MKSTEVIWKMPEGSIRVALDKKTKRPVAVIIPFYSGIWFDSDGFRHEKHFVKLHNTKKHIYKNGVISEAAFEDVQKYLLHDMPDWLRKRIQNEPWYVAMENREVL